MDSPQGNLAQKLKRGLKGVFAIAVLGLFSVTLVKCGPFMNKNAGLWMGNVKQNLEPQGWIEKFTSAIKSVQTKVQILRESETDNARLRSENAQLKVKLGLMRHDCTLSNAGEITRKYQSGSFDGMNDCYEYSASAWNEVFGGSKYVFTQRDFSAELITRAIAAVFEKYSGNLDETPMPTAEDYLNGRLYAARIPGIGGAPFDQMDVAVRAQASEMEA